MNETLTNDYMSKWPPILAFQQVLQLYLWDISNLKRFVFEHTFTYLDESLHRKASQLQEVVDK